MMQVISRISAKQVNLLYNHQPVARLSTMFAVSALFAFLYTPKVAEHLTAIYLFFRIIIALRFFANWRHVKNCNNNTVDIAKAYKIYLAGVIANGLGWRRIIFLIFPAVDLTGKILLLIVIMGFSAAAHSTLGFKKLPIVIFL